MLWVIIGFTVGILILSYFLFYLLGVNKIFYSFVKEGEIEFSVLGETLHKIWPNLRGYELKKDKVMIDLGKEKDGTTTTETIWADRFFPLPEGKETKKKFLGLYWIGIPPYCKILEYTFSWDRLITEASKKEEEAKGRTAEYTGIGDLWVSHRSELLNSLYFRYTYPIVVKSVELKGQITIDIAFNVTIEVVVPVIPIFFLKGRWFLPFTAAFKGIISDCLKGMELEDFAKMDKGNEFNLAIANNNELLISTTGMKSFQTNYIDYVISGSQEMIKAASAKKIAKLNAEAVVETAKGKAKSEILEAVGKAKSVRLDGAAKARKLDDLMKTANEHDGGVEVLKQQIFTEGLMETEISVLSLGQGSPLQFAVNAENKEEDKKKKVDKNKTTDTNKEIDKKKSDEKGEE